MACLTAVMEDLQWFDASLVMSEVMRTYNGGMPHSLLGGGREREGHHQPHLPHGLRCGTAFVFLWWLRQIHRGKLSPTTALIAAWPAPQM